MVTKEEMSLLKWLSTEDGQHGECCGKTLDAVMAAGLVEWKRRDPRGDNYGWVGLTEAGRQALKGETTDDRPDRLPHLERG